MFLLLRPSIERLLQAISAQHANLVLWIPVFLGAGSAFYFILDLEPSRAVVAGVEACAISLFLVALRATRRHEQDVLRWHVLFLLAGVFLCLVTGFTLAKVKADIVYTPMVVKETRPVQVTAILEHVEDQEDGKGKLVILRGVRLKGWPEEKTPKKIRLTVRKVMNGQVGDEVELLAKLTPPSPPVVPEGYDFARHYYFESIGALGFALSDVNVTKTAAQGITLASIRQKISESVAAYIPAREGGIVNALMTGERAAIAEEDWQALRASGLAHIISISGLHVVMVAAPVFFLVRLFLALIPYVALRYNIKKIAALIALVVCCLYVGLVVPSVPTTRALLMTGVGLIAIMVDRSPFSLRLVAVAATLVLVFSPEAVWSASFQMSFAAVTALVAVADYLSPFWGRQYQNAGWVKRGGLFALGSLLTSLLASLATAPFSLFHFQQVAVYSVLANFLAVPVTGLVIMPMLIFSYILIPMGLSEWSLGLMGRGVVWLLDIARFVEGLPFAQLTVPALPDSFLLWSVAVGMILIFMKVRWKALALIPMVGAGVMCLMTPQPDMLISSEGKLLAFKNKDDMVLSSKRREKFTAEIWRKRWNVTDDHVTIFPREGSMDFEDGAVMCDVMACRIEIKGHKIVVGESLYDLRQDCIWADVMVTPAYIPDGFCADHDVKTIDRKIFKHQGAVALFLTRGIEIKTVKSMEQNRPWQK